MKITTKVFIVLFFSIIESCDGTPDVSEFVKTYNSQNESKLITLSLYLDHVSYADTGFFIMYNKSRTPFYQYTDSSGVDGPFVPSDKIPKDIEMIIEDLGVQSISKNLDKNYYGISCYSINVPYKTCTIFLLSKYKPGDQFDFATKDTTVDHKHFYIINPRIAYRFMNDN